MYGVIASVSETIQDQCRRHHTQFNYNRFNRHRSSTTTKKERCQCLKKSFLDEICSYNDYSNALIKHGIPRTPGHPPDLLFIIGPHPDNLDGPDFTDDLVDEAVVNVDPA